MLDELETRKKEFPPSPFENIIETRTFESICKKHFNNVCIERHGVIGMETIPILNRESFFYPVCKFVVNALDYILLHTGRSVYSVCIICSN